MKKIICIIILLFMAVNSWGDIELSGVVLGKVQGVLHTDYTQDANCVGAWYMNSSATPEIDRSGNGNNLTYSNTPTTSNTVPDNFAGKSLDFDSATTDYLYSNSSDFDINGLSAKITLYVLFKKDNTSDRAIIGKYKSEGYDIELSSGEIIFEIVDMNSSWQIANSGVNCDTNQWYSVVGVYDGANVKIYIDGELKATTSNNNGISQTTQNFCIGYDGWGNKLDGLITEAAVFNRALSADEIQEIYQYGIDGTKGSND